MNEPPRHSIARIGRAVGYPVLVVLGAGGLTLAFFLVLPFLQSLNRPPALREPALNVDHIALPPPPPPPETEDEPEEEPDELEPPEMQDEAPPLDLSQLELALNAGVGEGWLSGDLAIDLAQHAMGKDDDALFALSDLDQAPRCISRAQPSMNRKVWARAPGEAVVIFIVDKDGRVQNARIADRSDPVFEGPALAAVRQWRFEPGTRDGEPVSFRMKCTVSFPKRSQ